MAGKPEVEIKFKVADIQDLTRQLEADGFRQVTERTHEMNTLYDLAGNPLRRRDALLRIRKYGPKWTGTYKERTRTQPGRHKPRTEIETQAQDGQTLAGSPETFGLMPGFTCDQVP